MSELETLRAGGMPPHDCVVDPPLRDLLDETADFIDAPDFPRVLGACVGRVFDIVLEKVGEAAGLAPTEEEVAAAAAAAQPGSDGQPFIHPRLRFQEIPEGQADEAGKKVRLANLLPVVSRQAHLVLNGLPNDCAEVRPFPRARRTAVPERRMAGAEHHAGPLRVFELGLYLVVNRKTRMRNISRVAAESTGLWGGPADRGSSGSPAGSARPDGSYPFVGSRRAKAGI